jgi:Wadjet protein JetD, C-terminal
MNMDSKRWRSCPWLRTLAFQWHEARGHAASDFQRPFSRDWEELLESANLISAESRNESFREAQALQAAGLVDLKTARYRSYQIERVIVPFAAEPYLRELFSDELPNAPEPKFDFASVKWSSQLAFLTTEFVTVASDDLLKLNEFLSKQPQSKHSIPIKERSLEIFGDEKRLDALLSTSLFRNGRLDWKKDLKCDIIGEPLGWKRGAADANAQPIIVIENAATWHSYCRWNFEHKLFSAVVYGCGNRFVDGVPYLADIFAELGGKRIVYYFGDLDPQGLLIPQAASIRTQAAGLPIVEPHLWSYRKLLSLGSGREQPWEGEPPSSTLCDWLGELARPAQQLFAANQRLAQEHVGWEFLQNQSGVG